MMDKRCTKCGETKSLEEFPKNRSRPDGHHSWCKICNRQHVAAFKATERGQQYYAEWEAKNRKAYNKAWRQTPKGREAQRRSRQSPAYQAYLRSAAHLASRRKADRKYAASEKGQRTVREHRLATKAKAREAGRKHYLRDPEAYKARAKAWRQQHPERHQYHGAVRRARKLASVGQFTLAEWLALCEKYDHRCLCCGKQAPEIKLSPDHVIPLARGGGNDIGNIQPLCVRCNCRKSAQTIDYRKSGYAVRTTMEALGMEVRDE
jgi:5-methylcytosine-specific restriction endonuclease McrA